jgi:hypothetical protein
MTSPLTTIYLNGAEEKGAFRSSLKHRHVKPAPPPHDASSSQVSHDITLSDELDIWPETKHNSNIKKSARKKPAGEEARTQA